jgi:serine/threonine protein kinase
MISDFEIMRLLGEGGFGQVLLAKKTLTDGQRTKENLFALKVVPNKFVSAVEREVFIEAAGHPFLVQLITVFQTAVICSFKHSMTMH